MRATDEILAKVKKLMALGASPSEAEAAAALEKARILLARYGLSIADVETSSPEITEGVILEKKRLRTWESHLIYVISSATFTQALHIRRSGIGQVLIIGREVNTLAASELFSYLHLVVLKLGRTHSAAVPHLESFRLGAVQRIGERLAALASKETEASGSGGAWGPNPEAKTKQAASASGPEPSERQLTVQMAQTADRENKSYIAEKYGKTTNKRAGRRVDAESYRRGWAAGDGVSLNRQLR